MVTLSNALLEEVVSETGGRIAQERFEFQTLWGARRLIQLYAKDENFAVGFEFHEDILEIDNPVAPTKLKLFQIKTKSSGRWTLSAMLKLKNGSSILGKLIRNKKTFSQHCSNASIVSNAEFSFGIGKKTITLQDFDDDAEKQFKTNLKNELGALDDEWIKGLEFWASDLHITNCQKVISHDIAVFVEKQLPGIHFAPSSVVLAFLDQCRSRSKDIADCSTFDELASTKFIARKDIDEWLGHIKQSCIAKPTLQLAIAQTKSMNIHRSLRKHWARYELDRSDIGNRVVQYMRDLVRDAIDNILTTDESFEQALESITKYMNLSAYVEFDAIDYTYVQTCIVYEYLMGDTIEDETRRKLSPTNSKSEDQN